MCIMRWVYGVPAPNLLYGTLHKKWSFPLKISSVNVTKFAGKDGFGHIYWKNP